MLKFCTELQFGRKHLYAFHQYLLLVCLSVVAILCGPGVLTPHFLAVGVQMCTDPYF